MKSLRGLALNHGLSCYGMIWHTLIIIIMAQNLCFCGMIWDTFTINIPLQNVCTMVLFASLDCPVDSNVYLRLPKRQFYMCNESGTWTSSTCP